MNPNPQTLFQPSETPVRIGVVIIGDEILSGKRADKHLPKLIELLGARGLQPEFADYVGDSPQRITATLKRAFDSGEVVFSCGGIGATPDDHTRQCAAMALGRPLQLHPEAAALIEQRMKELALEKGIAYEPERADNMHRLNMGMFPEGARIIPNPYNKIAGFSCAGTKGGGVHFVPGFPVMAWPMMEWVLDTYYAHLFAHAAYQERSVIVFGAMEAALTPLMESIEANFCGVRIFSLPSVDHPEYGRHIELGVKGEPALTAKAYASLLRGLSERGASLGPELVR